MCGWLIPSVINQMLLQISVSLAEYLCCSRQSLGVEGFFFFSSVSITLFLQKLVLIFQECTVAGVAGVRSQEYRWRPALAMAALIDLDISICCLYPTPFVPRILGSWGILPRKISAVWPFCRYHKDVSNLLKLSRNDKALPTWLCSSKYFLHQQRSRIYVR